MAARGHEVTWWTSSFDHFRKTNVDCSPEMTVQKSDVRLRFLRGRAYSRNISWARYRNHLEIARSFVDECATEEQPDLIVASMPTIELAYEAVRYGCANGITVVVDIRDLWPDEMYARIPRILQPLGRFLLRRMDRSVREALRGAHSLTAVSEAYLTWGLEHAGRNKTARDGVFTFGYPDPMERIGFREQTTVDVDLHESIHGRRIIWFVGTFVGSIDLTTVIDAARLLSSRTDLVFVFTGSGEREREWKRLARGLPNVIFTGWLDRTALDAYARAAWAGLGAYKAGALMSLTNKMFEYLAYGLPVLIGLGGEARRMIESAGAGIFYEPGNPASLASAVSRLLDSPATRDEMAASARNLFARRFSADIVYGRMSDHLLSLVRERRQSSGDCVPNTGHAE